MMRSIMLALLAAAAAGLSACAGGGPNLYQRLQDEDPKVRVEAAVEAGRTKDTQAVALLIERLSDSEQDVRFYSILALERITGQTFGYKCYEPVEARRQAIERWRQYAAKTARPATRPAGQSQVQRGPPRRELHGVSPMCPGMNSKDTGKMPVRLMGDTPMLLYVPADPLTSAQRSAP